MEPHGMRDIKGYEAELAVVTRVEASESGDERVSKTEMLKETNRTADIIHHKRLMITTSTARDRRYS
jgi:hypothetical protein